MANLKPQANTKANLHVRGVPETLMREVRMYCVGQGVTMREFVMAAIRDRLRLLERNEPHGS